MSDERLEVVQARAEGAGASAAASRRARVERSRSRAQQAKAGVDAVEADEAVEDAVDLEDETADDLVATPDEVEGSANVEDDDGEADVADDSTDDEAEDEAGEAAGDHEPGEYPGSVKPDADGSGPDTHPIKGNADSMLYHTPDSRYYKVTKAEVWFDSEESAEAAGFSKPGSKPNNESDED